MAARGRPTAELNAHPGERGERELERFRWDYHWGDELDALTDPRTAALVAGSGYELVGFTALGPDHRPRTTGAGS